MQSSKHIGKIVRQHADAVENGKVESRKRKSRTTRSSAFITVPKHRAFVPMVTIWGGLLLALITAVLPDVAIARVSSLTGVYLPLIIARLILAFSIGLGGALLGYIVSSALANRAKLKEGDNSLVSAFKSRDLQPIDVPTDLGSDSFDAPVEDGDLTQEPEPVELAELHDDAAFDEPHWNELARRGYEMEAPDDFDGANDPHKKGEWAFTRKNFREALIETCEGATCEAAFGAEARPEYASLTSERPASRREKPQALNLTEFGALPGRNAVWVEETEEVAPQASVSHSTPKDAPIARNISTPENALEKLRQKPTDDLSLVEMVERFAGALHEQQAQERARLAEGQNARETALAEALKALSLFTEAGFDMGPDGRATGKTHGQAPNIQDNRTQDELRGALARLNHTRGAA